MNTSPFTTGQGFLLAVSVLSWLAVAFTLTSTHLSTVVGAWLLAHGVEMAKFRAARRRLTGDMQRLAETMIPVAEAEEAETAAGVFVNAPHCAPKARHCIISRPDSSGGYIGSCADCEWRAVFPTLEEMQAAQRTARIEAGDAVDRGFGDDQRLERGEVGHAAQHAQRGRLLRRSHDGVLLVACVAKGRECAGAAAEEA
jgi:hypothetical protein